MNEWPYFAEDEVQAVVDVLKSGKVNYWTGKECALFEKEFAHYVGVKYAVSLSNGTVALELAMLALGVGPGDEVIVPSRTFIATASCVVLSGAKPVVADVDFESQNISADTIKPLINDKTKAIIVVHLAGYPCDMAPILALAKAHGLYVVEDCAQAHGATYHGQSVGSLGDIATFSFCQDKIMTTGGEGGMVLTNNEHFWKVMWAHKDHGKSFEKVYAADIIPGYRWIHDSFGTNFRMTEMQAAIGRIQLKKLNDWVNQRRNNAHLYDQALANITSVQIQKPKEGMRHAYYKYQCVIKSGYLKEGWSRDRIMKEINQQGVPCFTGGCSEIYREQAFINAGYGLDFRWPNAEKLSETNLMFLVHATLSAEYMENTIKIIKSVIKQATI